MAHDPKVKARGIALLLGGNSIGSVAKTLGLSKGSVQNWKRELDDVRNNTVDTAPHTQIVHQTAPDTNTNNTVSNTQKKARKDLMDELIDGQLESLVAQQKVHSDPKYLERQSAEGLAMLYGVGMDKMVRILEATQKANALRMKPTAQSSLPLDDDGP